MEKDLYNNLTQLLLYVTTLRETKHAMNAAAPIIIIFGLEELLNENKMETRERVLDLPPLKLQINIDAQHIDSLFWLGKQKQNRPLLIKFT